MNDSFEAANMQLMVETNELATRQRSLMDELSSVRIQCNSNSVDAMIGRELRTRLQRAVRRRRARVDESETGSSPPTSFESSISDDEADVLVSSFLKAAGYSLTLDDFKKELQEKQQLANVVELEELKESVKLNHSIISYFDDMEEEINKLHSDADSKQKNMEKFFAEMQGIRYFFSYFALFFLFMNSEPRSFTKSQGTCRYSTTFNKTVFPNLRTFDDYPLYHHASILIWTVS